MDEQPFAPANESPPQQRKLAFGTLCNVAARLAVAVCALVLQVAVVRVMGAKQYADYAVSMAVLATVALLVIYNLPYSVSNAIASTPHAADQIKRTGILLQGTWCLLVASACFALAPVIADLILRDPSLTRLLRIVAWAVVAIGMAQVAVGILGGERRFELQGLAAALPAVVRAAVALTLLVCGFGLPAILKGYVLAALGGAFVVVLIAGTGRGGLHMPGSLLRTAIPFAVIGIAAGTVTQLDILLAKRWIAERADVGHYAAASSLARFLQYLFAAFTMTVFPSVVASWRKSDVAMVGKYLAQTARYLVLLYAGPVAVVAGMGPAILAFVYGAGFAQAGGAFQLLLLFWGLFCVFSVFNMLLAAMERRTLAALLPVAIIGIMLAVGRWLIPRFGMSGAAWTVGIACGAMTTVCLGLVIRRFPRTLDLKVLAKTSFSAAGAGLVAWWISPQGIVIIPVAILGVALYVGLLFGLRTFDEEDRRAFAGLLSRVTHLRRRDR